MAYIKSNSCTNAWGRLKYLFSEPAHDGSDHRVLATSGANIRLFGSNGRVYPNQPAFFLNQQFKTVRQRARNKHKRQQAQHLIISFSDSEFSANDPDRTSEQAEQINQLVSTFMKEHFPSTQWVSAVQADGQGHKLHAHILINSVKPDGKCVQTHNFTVTKLRHEWDRFMESNYLAVTGHAYVNPFNTKKPATEPKPKGWQEQLKQILEAARQTAKTMQQYLGLLKQKHVSVNQRNKRGDWSYSMIVHGKKKTVRDFYQRIDRKTDQVKTTRGMGLAYTPVELTKNFRHKREKEPDHNDSETEHDTKPAEQHTRSDERQRSILEQLVTKRADDEQLDDTSIEARLAKPVQRSHRQIKRSRTNNQLER